MLAPARAQHIGGLLRPEPLKRAFRRWRNGALDDEGLHAVQEQIRQDLVTMQEAVGLRVVTDGELDRTSYFEPLTRAEGVAVAPPRQTVTDVDGHSIIPTAPSVTGVLRRHQGLVGHEVDRLRQLSQSTVKVALPSPSTGDFWAARDQPTPTGATDDPLEEVVRVYREEIAELAEDGPLNLQLDEVPLALLCDPHVRADVRGAGRHPEQLVDRYVNAISQLVEACPANMRMHLHLCPAGHERMWLAAPETDRIMERILTGTGVDTLMLPVASNIAPRALEALRFVDGDTTVALGAVSTRSPRIESRHDLLRLIDRAAQFMPAERLALSTDCGFRIGAAGGSITEDDQRRKLETIVGVATEV